MDVALAEGECFLLSILGEASKGESAKGSGLEFLFFGEDSASKMGFCKNLREWPISF